ncbi:MAG TPA: hypothetical protein DCR97_14700 [Deltaproteobacteria bacterium]|nr:hypothetical protein [Deltaproteobacteria bacterium]
MGLKNRTRRLTVDRKPGKIDPLEMAMRKIEAATAHLPHLDRRVLEKIRYTKRDVIVHFPAQMNSGEAKVFTGYPIRGGHPRPRRRRQSSNHGRGSKY